MRPFAVLAQQSAALVIGFLHSASREAYAPMTAAFRHGLQENGYVEGQNLAIEYRWADGRLERLPELAAHLVSRQVSLIFAGGGSDPPLWPARYARARVTPFECLALPRTIIAQVCLSTCGEI